MTTPVPIRCTGRPVDRHLQPAGEVCGRKLTIWHPQPVTLATTAAGGRAYHAVARYGAVAVCAGPYLIVAQARHQPHTVPVALRCKRLPCRTRWEIHLRELISRSRARGWRVGELPDGQLALTCDRCSRPDPTTVALCRALQHDPAPADEPDNIPPAAAAALDGQLAMVVPTRDRSLTHS